MSTPEAVTPAGLVPCYVSGKGMHATRTTWAFKTLVIHALESQGLGYDTRYRYYRDRFPDMDPAALARMICDPIEYYDEEWPAWRATHGKDLDEDRAVTAFMLERDRLFRDQARAAVYCYDEAGFGSGVNSMRFLMSGKPVLGFHDAARRSGNLNLSNVLQLEIEFPGLFTLASYRRMDDIPAILAGWLAQVAAPSS